MVTRRFVPIGYRSKAPEAIRVRICEEYVAISEKLMETVGQAEANQKLAIFDKILKIQLAQHIRVREQFPTEKIFLDCVRDTRVRRRTQ